PISPPHSFPTRRSSDLKLIALSILPMLLILLQNDMGTVLVMIAIFLGLVVVSGISWWLIIPTLTVAATTGLALILGILYRPDLLDRKSTRLNSSHVSIS